MINIKNVALSSPWTVFYREIEALFKDDPDIKIVYDENNLVIKLFVDKEEKANALMQILPSERTFGKITIKLEVIPSNDANNHESATFRKAFEGNPILAYMVDITDIFANPISYVVFKKEVVQYFNDDLSDAHGVCSTLYQNIAKDVFGERNGIFFCTDTEEKVGKPLGEWP